ncbi:MAG TPA: hypothetical protein VJ743_14340, partial [Albitalea sp.]|nr:hypothetical protein [Albitalea sp.]
MQINGMPTVSPLTPIDAPPPSTSGAAASSGEDKPFAKLLSAQRESGARADGADKPVQRRETASRESAHPDADADAADAANGPDGEPAAPDARSPRAVARRDAGRAASRGTHAMVRDKAAASDAAAPAQGDSRTRDADKTKVAKTDKDDVAP